MAEEVVVELVDKHPSEHQCKEAAYAIWEERGSIDPDPLTDQNWLLAQQLLLEGETDVRLHVRKMFAATSL